MLEKLRGQLFKAHVQYMRCQCTHTFDLHTSPRYKTYSTQQIEIMGKRFVMFLWLTTLDTTDEDGVSEVPLGAGKVGN